MAAELVNHATSEKLSEMDWMKNIEICELVARDHRQAREVVKAIKKRLGSKNTNTQLYTVMLLEMLMNNIGEHIHKQVIDTAVLPILVKMVKKKSDLHVREKIFLLLDATQTSLGGASGKFPQYYDAYYNLVSAGVKFPQVPRASPVNNHIPQSDNNHSSNGGELPISRHEGVAQQAEPRIVPESRYIEKANNALEVLKEVLDAVDTQHPEGAKDEFTLDLVEQCSFQKQRVMHLVMTSRDEKVISRAIDLNDQLEKVLSRHDALVSGRHQSVANNGNCDEVEDEEEAEQLFRRIRKGKACATPEGEVCSAEQHPSGLLGTYRGEALNRPLIRPVCLEPSNDPIVHLPPVSNLPASNNSNVHPATVVIPPPPAKHIEREKFFLENRVDASSASGHMRGVSWHSRNASSSRSGSLDFNE